MDFKTTSTNRIACKAQSRGVTFIEFMVASALSSIVLLALGSLSYYSARTFASIANYTDLDNKSRGALDVMTKDIRQCEGLTNASANKLEFNYAPNVLLSYLYDSSLKTLTRKLANSATGVTTTKVLLTECDFLEFAIFKRNPLGGTYDQYPTTVEAPNCKLVQLNWVCSRQLLGMRAHTESVQSAKIVIRRQ